MSSFTAPLRFESTDRFLGGRRIYRTTRELIYRVGGPDSPLELAVPGGFETDLASVPAFARALFAPDGPWAPGAVLHDHLYRTALISRAMADRIFLESMAVLGIARWRRGAMYAAVRVGGWAAYGRRFF